MKKQLLLISTLLLSNLAISQSQNWLANGGLNDGTFGNNLGTYSLHPIPPKGVFFNFFIVNFVSMETMFTRPTESEILEMNELNF